jgi:hypothetical protein
VENFTCDLLQSRLSYESIWLKVDIAKQLSAQISHTEFQQYLYKRLWAIWKLPLMILRKVGFIVDQHGWKLVLPNNS